MQPDVENYTDLGFGASCYTVEGGRILAYVVNGAGQDISDVWAVRVIADVQAHPKDKSMLLLQDMSQSGFTPYGDKRARDIAMAIPDDAEVYLALVLSNSIIGKIIKGVAYRALKARLKENTNVKIFLDDRDAAIQWLRQFM